jgi:hypothetical protein
MLSIKRPETLLSAMVTALAPAGLMIVTLIMAMVVPRHATLIILGGAAVAAAVFFSLPIRSQTSRDARAGPRSEPADKPGTVDQPETVDKTLERVR